MVKPPAPFQNGSLSLKPLAKSSENAGFPLFYEKRPEQSLK